VYLSVDYAGKRCIGSSHGGHDAAILIDSGEVNEGVFPRRAAKLVKEWALQHTVELSDNWERAQRGEPLLEIAPLE
jgi:hypothetical protein